MSLEGEELLEKDQAIKDNNSNPGTLEGSPSCELKKASGVLTGVGAEDILSRFIQTISTTSSSTKKPQPVYLNKQQTCLPRQTTDVSLAQGTRSLLSIYEDAPSLGINFPIPKPRHLSQASSPPPSSPASFLDYAARSLAKIRALYLVPRSTIAVFLRFGVQCPPSRRNTVPNKGGIFGCHADVPHGRRAGTERQDNAAGRACLRLFTSLRTYLPRTHALQWSE